MSTVRHLTATGFVAHDNQVLLHWHSKVKAWLPPGGHINENEDPVQAVLREIREETGIAAEIASPSQRLDLDYPTQLPPPFTIMVEDIQDPEQGYHQHIDLIYFCRPVEPRARLNDGWIWVGRDALIDGAPLEYGDAPLVPAPADVRLLALRALDLEDH